MRNVSAPLLDGQGGVPFADFVYRMSERSGKGRSDKPTAHLTGKGEITISTIKLIAPDNAASGNKVIRFNTGQTGILRKFQHRIDSFITSLTLAWLGAPRGIRLAIIVSLTLLLGILIGLFIQHYHSPAPSPVWKSFSLSQ